MRPSLAAIALGSNLGDRAAQLASAVDRLASIPLTSLVAASTWFETAPVGPIEQPNFLNAAALVRTLLPPETLLVFLHAIERDFGRDRRTEQRWGPRTLDLDLIVHGESVLVLPDLVLPHPRAHERGFVLEPLAQIAPDLVIPGRGPVSQLLADWRIKHETITPGVSAPCDRQ
ncbi:MAG: 2-amino-4-hydroxy-6-hydroxymethyldihydropteridine diphosphokinase [bacterium]|nr:2-amino-4-hydroxy-6-hydroxymethyldihydropteridine diphosphokinase [bacterium]